MSNQNIIRPPKRLTGDTEAVIRHIYDQINVLSNATNRASTGEGRDRTGGKSGDLQLVHDKASGQYGIEGRFEEGWMRFGLGEGVLVQSNQRGPFIPPSQNDPTNITKTIQDMFPAITKLRLDVNPGTVTSLPIIAIGTDNILKDGDIITVVSSNGYVATFVVAANVLAAATTITVESAIIGKRLTAGSSVYLTQKSLGTWISELENSITIGAGINDFDVITRVNEPSGINGNVYTFPIDPPLPIKLKSGWKLLATNPDTGDVYTLVLYADINAGSTSLSFTSQTLTLPDNSPIRLDQLSLLSYITLAAGEAVIEAQAMQGAILIGYTGIGINNGTNYNINVPAGVTINLETSDVLFVQASDDLANLFQFSPSSPIIAGGTIIWNSVGTIHSGNFIPVGSPIYLSPSLSAGRIKIAYDEINLSVKKDVFRDFLNGTLLGEVTSVSAGSHVNLVAPGLTNRIYKGDIVTFRHNPDASQTELLNPSVTKRIRKADSNPYAVGTTASILTGMDDDDMVADTTGISPNMLMFMEQAGYVRIGSSMQLFVDSIVVDTPVLRSGNYDPGVDGWAINGNGSAEFNDVVIRGDILMDALISGGKPIAGDFENTVSWRSDSVPSQIALKLYAQEGVGLATYNSLWIETNFGNSLVNYLHLNKFDSISFGDPGVPGQNYYALFGVNDIETPSEFLMNVPLKSQSQQVPRVFSGSGVPSAVTNSVIGDLYRRTGTEELYIKTSNTPTWLKIGPFVDGDFMTYSSSTGNPSSTPANGAIYYDTTGAKAHIRVAGSWFPFFNGIKNAYNTSNTYLGPVMVWRGRQLGTPPSNAEEGHMYTDSANVLKVYDGSNWQDAQFY